LTPGCDDRLSGAKEPRRKNTHMQNRLYVGKLEREVATATLQEPLEPHGPVAITQLGPDKAAPRQMTRVGTTSGGEA
jgi:hypothetical protein